VPCDVITFVEFDASHELAYLDQSLPEEPPPADPGEEAFWRHYWDCLPCSYPERTGDERSITTISDFYTQRDYQNTGMYADFFGPLGVEYDAVLCLSAPAGRSRRLLFFRGRGADFDGRDRLVLSLLRPHLNELYQELERRRRKVPELTSRQWELLRLVASGRTNPEIAKELFLSRDTVRKHLEKIYGRLEVATRTAAVARAFPAHPY